MSAFGSEADMARSMRNVSGVADNSTGRLCIAVLTVQVREQEYEWKCEWPDNRSNPSPNFKAASATLCNSTSQIDRAARNDHRQCQGYVGAHNASSNAACAKV